MNGAIVHGSLTFAATAGYWFVTGALLGLAHFRTLRWNVRCMIGGRPLLALALQVLRFAATGAALTLIARGFGTLPLLAGTLGLLAARTGLLLLEPQ